MEANNNRNEHNDRCEDASEFADLCAECIMWSEERYAERYTEEQADADTAWLMYR